MTRLGPSVCRDLNGRYQDITVICEAKSAGMYSGTAVLQLPVQLVGYVCPLTRNLKASYGAIAESPRYFDRQPSTQGDESTHAYLWGLIRHKEVGQEW
jgi:hypothetical protein